MLDSSRSIEIRETEFSTKIYGNCSECLKKVLSLVNGFMIHFNSPYVSLVKYDSIGINRGLCSLKTYNFSPKEIQEILWSFSRIVIGKTQQLGCILRTNLQ